jgi:hypothetical protein
MEINESKINELFTSWKDLNEQERTAFSFQVRGYMLSADALPKKNPVGRPRGKARKAPKKEVLAETTAE